MGVDNGGGWEREALESASDQLTALRARLAAVETDLTERENNAADLIRHLLGYEDEPDESTAGLIYAAIEGNAEAFRAIIALSPAAERDEARQALAEVHTELRQNRLEREPAQLRGNAHRPTN